MTNDAHGREGRVLSRASGCRLLHLWPSGQRTKPEPDATRLEFWLQTNIWCKADLELIRNDAERKSVRIFLKSDTTAGREAS